VFQTDGEPPSSGSAIFVKSGCTQNKSAALANAVVVNRAACSDCGTIVRFCAGSFRWLPKPLSHSAESSYGDKSIAGYANASGTLVEKVNSARQRRANPAPAQRTDSPLPRNVLYLQQWCELRKDEPGRIAMAADWNNGRRWGLIHVGALLLLAAVAWMPAAAVESEESGWVDAILDFFGLSESEGDAYAEDEAATAELFRMGQELIAEIELLRDALTVVDIPVEAEPLAGRGPSHLHVKAWEVMAKIRRFRHRHGFGGLPEQPPSIGEFTGGNLLPIMGGLVSELRELKSLLKVEGRIERIPSVGGRTYSMVYKQLGDASFLLDGLAGQGLTARDVFRNLAKASDLIGLIAAQTGSDLVSEPPDMPDETSATDLQVQLVLAIEKAVALQSRMGLAASRVPSLSLVRVGPSEHHDAVNILFAELLRIAFHLNIEGMTEERPVPLDRPNTDVYALALFANANLGMLGEKALW